MDGSTVIPSVTTLFQQPWWLDAVAPDQWGAAEIVKGGVLAARMPYVARRRFGLHCLCMPSLTPSLGPWMRSTEGGYAARLSQEKELFGALIDQLPPFDYFAQAWHHSMHNFLPFYWRGFECLACCTYVLDDLSDPDRLWHGFQEHTRRQVRKAQRMLIVRSDLGVDRLIALNEMTFRRQAKELPYPPDLVRRIDSACRLRNAGRAFFAEDSQGRVHAALYLVWDAGAAYYLLGGADSDLRQSGAMSLLIHEAIRFSNSVTRTFDFEGSMLEPIERFFRGFSAVQKPYFVVRGYSRRMQLLRACRTAMTRIAG